MTKGIEGQPIEIPEVRKELYNRTLEAVEQAGYNFIVPIRPVSIEDLFVEDEQRKRGGELGRFGFINRSRLASILATVPPEMEIAINPDRFKIMGSNYLSTDEQKKKIEEEQTALRRQVPPGIQHLVIMEMVDPSTISQIEDAYIDRTGKLLFPDYFVRTDAKGIQGHVAFIGRADPRRPRAVSDWERNDGCDVIFAVSVVVLPQVLYRNLVGIV